MNRPDPEYAPINGQSHELEFRTLPELPLAKSDQ
jgi:hypothetical protein